MLMYCEISGERIFRLRNTASLVVSFGDRERVKSAFSKLAEGGCEAADKRYGVAGK